MPVAFLLINTEIGSESEVFRKLKEIDAVEDAFVVYGVYDILAKLKASTMDKLKENITSRVRGLDQIQSTLTMIVIEQRE